MLLSYLIIPLSIFFVPLAHGRPASAPSHKTHRPAPPAEPNALLGRHYLVHEHREGTHTHTVSATTESYRAQQTSRHAKPFARYFADRSGDIWVHERRAPAPFPLPLPLPLPLPIPQADSDVESGVEGANYVSHVGPYPYEPPPSPSHTTAQYDHSSPSSTVPVQNFAAAPVNATTMPPIPYPSSSSSSPTGPSKSKKARAKAKLHRAGKKEYLERKY